MSGRRIAMALIILSGLAVTSACTGPASDSPSIPATAVPSSPVATPGSTGEAGEAPEPTCETIISATTAADFKGLGWTVKQAPFIFGDTQLPDGLQCTWGDYSVASDHVQVFGWATVTDEQATTARGELEDNGWREIEEDDVIYITESPDTAAATDEDGFGITYQLGDGWVKMADTKQGLLLVEWPPN